MSVHAIPPVFQLVDHTGQVSASELAHVAHSLSTQLVRDVAHTPWRTSGTVTSHPAAGAWLVFIEDDIGMPGAAGVHMDDHGQPYALVQYGDGWPTTASHEIVEAALDPFGMRMVAGKDPSGHPCRLLIEVADPCESESYDIDGIAVSDFVYPAYYRTVRHDFYDYMGRVSWGRGVLPGGYLSWQDMDGAWWQRTFFGGSKPVDNMLAASTAALHDKAKEIAGGALPGALGPSVRELVDVCTRAAKAAA